jgi:hypothetical protein
MSDAVRFQRVAGIAAICCAVLMTGNIVALFASVNSNPNAFTDPALLLAVGAKGASLFRASMVFDLFAHLTFVPIVIFCWLWLQTDKNRLILLYTFCGFAYALFGSLGAAMLGSVVPRLISAYALAGASQREVLRVVMDVFYRAIAFGVWNPLEVLMVSAWFLGTGSLLLRKRAAIGVFALVVGLFSLLDPLGWIANSDLVFDLGGGGTALAVCWLLWFGIDLLRRPAQLAEPGPGLGEAQAEPPIS